MITRNINDLNNLPNPNDTDLILIENTDNKTHALSLKQLKDFIFSQTIKIEESGTGGRTFDCSLSDLDKASSDIKNINTELYNNLLNYQKPLNYRKWSDGTAECWGKLFYPLSPLQFISRGIITLKVITPQATEEQIKTVEGTAQYSFNKIIVKEGKTLVLEEPALTFPDNLFIEAPVLNITLIGENSSIFPTSPFPYIPVKQFYINEVSESTFSGIFTAQLPAGSTLYLSQSPEIHVHAIGRWK